MKAIIVSSGNELTTGQVFDSNSTHLAEELTGLGVNVLCHITVEDDIDRVVWAIRESARLADLVVITGGLGPTQDDLTRFALAQVAGVELSERPELIEAIAGFFKQRGRTMSQINRIQALLPEGATGLANSGGTAPGILMQLGESTIFALPGVPREMRQMFVTHVVPWVSRRVSRRIHRVDLRCVGTGESNIMQRVMPLVENAPNVRFGTRVSESIITVKLSGEDPEAVDDLAAKIRTELGQVVFGEADETLAEVVGRLLRDRRQSLAVAESCTGGLLGELITDVPGSSDFFLGGYLCYSNELKVKDLHVPNDVLARHGAVSERCAEALLTGVLNVTAADWAIAITGIAGPGGGTAEKPVGLIYIATGSTDARRINEHRFGDIGRRHTRYRAAITALNTLRLMLMDS